MTSVVARRETVDHGRDGSIDGAGLDLVQAVEFDDAALGQVSAGPDLGVRWAIA